MAGIRSAEGDAHREDLLTYLREHQKKHRYLPSLAQASRDLKMSRTTIQWHLDKLRESKKVDFEDGNMSRSLRLR